jgi:hypothetical protein
MEPIEESGGRLRVLGVARDSSGSWVSRSFASPDNTWSGGGRLLVCRKMKTRKTKRGERMSLITKDAVIGMFPHEIIYDKQSYYLHIHDDRKGNMFSASIDYEHPLPEDNYCLHGETGRDLAEVAQRMSEWLKQNKKMLKLKYKNNED